MLPTAPGQSCLTWLWLPWVYVEPISYRLMMIYCFIRCFVFLHSLAEMCLSSLSRIKLIIRLQNKSWASASYVMNWPIGHFGYCLQRLHQLTKIVVATILVMFDGPVVLSYSCQIIVVCWTDSVITQTSRYTDWLLHLLLQIKRFRELG